VHVAQGHDDRDVEYLVLKDQLNGLVRTFEDDVGGRSCEMLAQQLLEGLAALYPARDMRCEVTEDGENGAVVEA
jgi:hypothetical protein